MPTARISQILGQFNLKYVILSLVFAAFLILSGVFTGFASEPPNFSKASSPTTIWSSAKVAPLVTPHAVQVAQLQQADFQLFLPLIIKQTPLRFGPDGLGLLDAILLAPSASANREVVAAQVTLTPPNPTVTPGGASTSTPVPTPLPGSPTFTATPKLTVTPTASPTPTPELIPNGDFEDGEDGWTTFSLRDHRIIFDEGNDELPELPISPTSGDWAVWLGGDDSELSYIQRTIFLPANKPVIAHRYYIHSVDPVCASDLFSDFTVATQFRDGNENTLNNLQSDVGGLIISDGNTTATYVIDLCARMGTNGWGTIIYDTRFFGGKVVSIRFKTISDSQATSSLFIDDIIIQSDFLGLNPPAPTLNGPEPLLLEEGEAPPGATVVEPDLVIETKGTPAAPD
jgi:hypothetical protein